MRSVKRPLIDRRMVAVFALTLLTACSASPPRVSAAGAADSGSWITVKNKTRLPDVGAGRLVGQPGPAISRDAPRAYQCDASRGFQNVRQSR